MSSVAQTALAMPGPFIYSGQWPMCLPAEVRGLGASKHYDRARGNLDRHGVHFLTAYVAGV